MKFKYLDKEIDFSDEVSEENKIYNDLGTFYEIDFLEYIRSLKLYGAYVDVGTHIGNDTIYFSNFCSSSRVYSFEPLKYFYNIAKENIHQNVPPGKCILKNFGLSEMNTTETFSFKGISESIDLQCMDDVLDSVTDVCIIKVDVNGHETAVLNGARKSIKQCRLLIFVEAVSQDAFDKVALLLKSLGYYSTGKVFN